jgi:flagellar export protein FliJ
MKGAFRLAVVLRLREMAEDAARARLGRAVEAHRRATEHLVALLERELTAQRRIESLADAGTTAGELAVAQRALERAEQAVAAGRVALEAAQLALLEARQALAEATRRREVVERLRDRLALQQAIDAQRREDAVLSEIAGVRHARSLTQEVDR